MTIAAVTGLPPLYALWRIMFAVIPSGSKVISTEPSTGSFFYFRFFCTLCLRVEILSSGRVLAHFAFVLAVFLQCIVDLVCISGIKRHYLTAILNYLTDIFVFCDNTVKTVLHLIITY